MKFNIVVFDTFYDKNNVTMYFDIYMIKFHNTVTLVKISFFSFDVCMQNYKYHCSLISMSSTVFII